MWKATQLLEGMEEVWVTFYNEEKDQEVREAAHEVFHKEDA